MSLEVKTLDYEIRGKEILKDISLEIHTKEFVGLVGPNGCGKSTLLKNIYRTLRPKYNTVFIDGNDILKLSSRKMARELAVMAQENNMEFDFKVQDMVMFGRYSHKKFFREIRPGTGNYVRNILRKWDWRDMKTDLISVCQEAKNRECFWPEC